jgi:hypothetical protein
MEVKKLQAYIQAFRTYLQRDRVHKEIYKWQALNHFQEHWDLEAVDFAGMYDQSLQSQTTQRLWKRETWRPKEVMQQLIQQDAEFARRMFRLLFDESQNIETRISMFKFGCEELLQEFKKQHRTTIVNNHYHDDNQMILLYLTFRYPEQYTFFDYPPFVETLKRMNIKDLPDPYNLERFFKLTKIMNTFLQKDEVLLEGQRQRLPANYQQQGISKLLVHDFYCFAATANL